MKKEDPDFMSEEMCSEEDIGRMAEGLGELLNTGRFGISDLKGAVSTVCGEMDIPFRGTMDATLSDDAGRTLGMTAVDMRDNEPHLGVLIRRRFDREIDLDRARKLELAIVADSYTIPEEDTSLRELFFPDGSCACEVNIESDLFEFYSTVQGQAIYTNCLCEPPYSVIDLVFGEDHA